MTRSAEILYSILIDKIVLLIINKFYLVHKSSWFFKWCCNLYHIYMFGIRFVRKSFKKD